jgi:dTDP-4-amino-4,6-dideoxygalactose transaminase
MNEKRKRQLAILGGEPLFPYLLNIVRPRFPALSSFLDRFAQGLERGQVTNHGPAVAEFEEKVADYCGAPAVVCNNGQTALMIMLRAADIEAGEVIVPSYTFSATPHAVRWCGATPVFADMRGMVLDPTDAERRITSRTVAMLGVDVYGLACDYDAFESIGRKHGIRVLFDSAPSFGTRFGGKPVGARGDAQMFSFHATKAFTTMEGGAVVSRDPELVRRARALRNFGQLGGADCDEPGVNGKMMEISALIGIEQLKGFDDVVQHRFEITEIMRAELIGIPGVSLTDVPAAQLPVWLYFPIVIDAQRFGMNRDQLAAALERENIQLRKYFEMPCHHMKAYRNQRSVSLPESERAAYNVLALPVYNDMTEGEARGIARAIREIHEQAGEVAASLAPRLYPAAD